MVQNFRLRLLLVISVSIGGVLIAVGGVKAQNPALQSRLAVDNEINRALATEHSRGTIATMAEALAVQVRKQGGRPFEPMPGRAMTGYVVVPSGWQKKPDATRTWIITALAWSRKLPAKAPKTAKTAAPKKSATTSRSR